MSELLSEFKIFPGEDGAGTVEKEEEATWADNKENVDGDEMPESTRPESEEEEGEPKLSSPGESASLAKRDPVLVDG